MKNVKIPDGEVERADNLLKVRGDAAKAYLAEHEDKHKVHKHLYRILKLT